MVIYSLSSGSQWAIKERLLWNIKKTKESWWNYYSLSVVGLLTFAHNTRIWCNCCWKRTSRLNCWDGGGGVRITWKLLERKSPNQYWRRSLFFANIWMSDVWKELAALWRWAARMVRCALLALARFSQSNHQFVIVIMNQ